MSVMALEALPALEGAGAEASTVTTGNVGGGAKLSPAITKATGMSPSKAPTSVGNRRSSGSSRKSSGSRKKSSGRKRRGSGKLPSSLTFGGDGSNAHKLVVAEFILCVVIIGFNPIMTRKPQKKGSTTEVYITNDFVRLTAVCLLFFVLALMANTRKYAKISAAFGGLVTLGVLWNANSLFVTIANLFNNAQKARGQETAAPAGTSSVSVASYTPVDFTTELAGETESGGGGISSGNSGPVST